MKKYISIILLLCYCCLLTYAAPFRFLETIVTQADGSQLTLYASGDEFYHWVHDKDGYTIVQADDGYCYYAVKNDKGEMVPSSCRADKALPKEVSINPWLKIPKKRYEERREQMRNQAITRASRPQYASHKNPLNNIVIFVSFQDVTTFSKKRTVYDSRFNSTTSSSGSLKDYYQEVSYSSFDITSHFYPKAADLETKTDGYIDFHKRGFYRPYNATTNPDGYRTSDESTNREHNLIVNAIDAVKASIEEDFTPEELDNDNDGYIDNVCFVVQGNSDGWSDLLWAHRWSLYTKECYIHGKRVMDYVFQPENQVTINTLCHEMFHALGAPDLYHYSEESKNLDPVGSWDLMNSGWCHMGAYMKWRYAGQSWIKEMPTITQPGTYTLLPLSQSAENSCYRVNSTNPNEYYVLEYRKKEGRYEKNLIRSGLLIYRINTTVKDGNRNGPPDEVYIYRPFGSLTENGFLDEAAYQTNSGAVMTDKTFPKPFLSDDSDGGLRITNVIMEDDKLTFDINSIPTGLESLSDNRKIQLLFNEGILYVTADTNVDHITVVDISGKILEDVKNVTQLSLKHLSKGTYIVSVLSGNDIYKRKIFIE
ncbi:MULTISPECIES: M6 family metalloprotease domain-containing protein [Bacteroides]|uniref:M6 family metalloprotease domain-containing protein n=1 Tax=Bacteroides TaxID=816 RepID=UPI002A8236D1|nr:M6 family metalloprotease domain-containing protein [Bacteroides nordii]